MYKRAAKLWQSIRNLAGKFGPPSKKGRKSAASQGRKAAREYLKQEKLNKKVPCEICTKSIANGEMSDHLFNIHHLSLCTICKKHITSEVLREHIKDKHGPKKFQKWLADKERRDKLRSKVEFKQTKSKGKEMERPIAPAGESKRCDGCGQMVDINLIPIHTSRYCKRSNA